MAHHSDEVTGEYIQSDSGKLKTESRRALKFANLCLISLAILTGCASTRVYEIRSSSSDRRLPKPERVFVYDFAISPEDTKVHGEPGGRLQGVGSVSQTEEELKIGREVANILAAELVKAIGDLGLPAKRATPGTVLLVLLWCFWVRLAILQFRKRHRIIFSSSLLIPGPFRALSVDRFAAELKK